MGVMQTARRVRFFKRLAREWNRARQNAAGWKSTVFGAVIAVLSAFAYMETGSMVKLLEGFGLTGEQALAGAGLLTFLIFAFGVRGRTIDDADEIKRLADQHAHSERSR